jgi:hypothetical protein
MLYTRVVLGLFLFAAPAVGAAIIGGGCQHITDGAFDSNEWNASSCPTMVKSTFSPPGAALYVDQGQLANNNLYLMYDFFGGGGTAASFFDVFFEVVPDNTDYLVRIQGAGLRAFERTLGTTAPILPNGSFDVGPTSGWNPLLPGDPDLQAFHAALGFGPSPDSGTPHPMAEFQVTIDRPGAPGLYSPDPAFWGASEKSSGGADPPISSGIFQLNPDGTTLLAPILGPNGDPVMTGSAVPEPGTLLVMASGLLLVALRCNAGLLARILSGF